MRMDKECITLEKQPGQVKVLLQKRMKINEAQALVDYHAMDVAQPSRTEV